MDFDIDKMLMCCLDMPDTLRTREVWPIDIWRYQCRNQRTNPVGTSKLNFKCVISNCNIDIYFASSSLLRYQRPRIRPYVSVGCDPIFKRCQAVSCVL
eukprot:28367_6